MAGDVDGMEMDMVDEDDGGRRGRWVRVRW
jgi:hypothetical protein